MYSPVILALGATVFTWFVTALGSAAVLFFRRRASGVLEPMIGFASGVMIAASFWSLLQPAIERAEESGTLPPWLVAAAGFLGGAVFMWCADKAVSRFSGGAQSEPVSRRMRRIWLLVLSITLHNIPEGLAVGVAFGAAATDPDALLGAISIALGVGLQNFPEGAAVSLPLLREGFSRKRSFLWGQASAIVEPVAGVVGAALVIRMEAMLPYALSFAAGAMILVAVHELIPECQRNQEQRPWRATAGILLGFAAMMILDVMLG